jgi:hypothetical protein
MRDFDHGKKVTKLGAIGGDFKPLPGSTGN